MTSSRTNALWILAAVSVAIYLVPEGAHFFEMFSKMRLAPNDYMTVQRIYNGWALFGVVILLALACTLGLAVAMWRDRRARWLALAAFAALLGTQAIFWTFIFPMNVLTRNWTEMPGDFEGVRHQWEHAHAVSAALTLFALVLVLSDVRPAATDFPQGATGSTQRARNIPPLPLVVTAVLGTGAFIALAIVGWGGARPFFSHPPLVTLTVVTALLTLMSMFTAGNLSSGVREDRSNRWVLAAFAILGVLIGWLPALTDRLDWGTIDGDATRWIGVALFTAGGMLRLWPVFVLGRRFSGLVAIQSGHRLVTTGLYRWIRHPSYLGMLITIVGWALAFRSVVGLLLALATLVPVIGRMNAEEALLADEFREEYRLYRARTARLLPGLY